MGNQVMSNFQYNKIGNFFGNDANYPAGTGGEDGGNLINDYFQYNVFNDNTIFNNSNYVDKHGLFLPSYITLSNNDITHICKIITLFFTKS